MDPLRRAVRRAFNAIDPAGLYDLTGDPDEYQVEVDCLVTRIRTIPPNGPEAMARLVHQVLCHTLHNGTPVGVLLPEDGGEQDPVMEPAEDLGLISLRSCYPITAEETQLGEVIWEQLAIHSLYKHEGQPTD